MKLLSGPEPEPSARVHPVIQTIVVFSTGLVRGSTISGAGSFSKAQPGEEIGFSCILAKLRQRRTR